MTIIATTTEHKTTNMLVSYHGGGYDGCIWEWNYFFFDRNGEFHNLHATGYHGITDAVTARELLREWYADNIDALPRGFTVQDLDSDAKIDLCTADHSLAILAHLSGLSADGLCPDPYVTCDVCGEQIHDTENARAEGWHGCGGIAMCADEIVCSSCHDVGTCQDCREYYEPSTLTMGRCDSCYHKEYDNAIDSLVDAIGEYTYLEYSRIENRFGADADYELDADAIEYETLWLVTVLRRTGRESYVVDAQTAEAALDHVDIYLGGDYYETVDDTPTRLSEEYIIENYLDY